MSRRNNNKKWPKRDKLIEAIDTFENFRGLCKLELDLGYWATVDFPSKHHINKILSVQYMDRDILIGIYGKVLTNRVFEVLPHCKNYLKFLRSVDEKVES